MFSILKEENYSVVKVDNEKLNSIIAPELKNTFVNISSEGEKNMALDLSGVKFCDSSGLSAILVGNRVCRNANGTFVVVGVKDMVEKLIQISQLDSILNLASTVSEAKDIIYMEEVERELDNDQEKE